jgi:outer membrane lipoprotein LolB
LLVLLAGCAALPEYGPVEQGFLLRGKLGIVQQDESFSARVLWRQTGDRFTMDLWGPLGQGRVTLTGRDEYLELKEADGTVISAGPPERVMQQHLGWSLPLSVLPQWVRGRPARDLPVAEVRYGDGGHLERFEQIDWQVELERYRPVAEGAGGEGEAVSAGAPAAAAAAMLPHRVTARRGDYRVRLAISDWQI